MMKRIRLTYVLLLAMVLPLLTACSGDDMSNDPTQQNKDGKITVHLRVSQASPSVTMRAWHDTYAKDYEMMNVWTTVVVNKNNNTVVAIFACKPSADNREIDSHEELPEAGTYRFYSFANIPPKDVLELLGITNAGIDEIDNFMTTTASNSCEVTSFNLTGKTLTVAANIDQTKTVNVNGNQYEPTATTNYGFGPYGIPMSNVQEITVTDGDGVDLVVVRMLAKMELWVYNDKDTDVTIENVTLTDITAYNSGGADNLKLFPKYTSTTTNGNGLMDREDYEHADIRPNLNGAPATADRVVTLTGDKGKVSATANKYNEGEGTPVKITFYVNESNTPAITPDNQFKHFLLKIKLSDETEARYTLIDKGKDANGNVDDKWNYIARNDYRIIPIVLDDYKLDIIPYDFPAIGVWSTYEKGIYNIRFHNFGHFHLQPVVTKYSNGDIVPYGKEGDSKPYWTLYDGSFGKAWTSWKDATKAAEYDNENVTNPLYRKGHSADPDASESGGAPAWASNDGPTWNPHDGENGPYIYGFLEDPGDVMSDDKKVYHEFSIHLYKEGMDVPRTMIYRLYMILDKDQMKYPQQP